MTNLSTANRRLLTGLAAAALLISGLLAHSTGVTLALATLVLVVVLVLYPEVTLSLFLLAGVIKTPLAMFATAAGVEIDATLLLAALLAAGVFIRGMKLGFRALLPPADLLVPLGCLSLLVLLSALLGPETPYGRDKALRFITLTNLALVAPLVCLNHQDRLRRFLLVNIALGLLMLPLGHVSSEGLIAFGSTHIATGRALGFGVLGSVYLYLRRPSLAGRLFWLAVGAALLAGLLLSGSRGSFVALVVAVVVAGVLALVARRGRRRILAVAAAAGTMALGVTLFAPTAAETMNRRLTTTVADPLTLTARTRLERATAAVDAFVANPVFGVGIGGFDVIFANADTGRGDYPHNVFLELAAELGLLGLAAFLLLLFRSLRRPLVALLHPERAAGTSPTLSLFILALTCYALVNALFSGDLNDNRLLFAVLGMCFVPIAETK